MDQKWNKNIYLKKLHPLFSLHEIDLDSYFFMFTAILLSERKILLKAS